MGLTTRQLITLLMQEDPEAEVWLEGCDCSAPAENVESRRHKGVRITGITRGAWMDNLPGVPWRPRGSPAPEEGGGDG